MLIYIIVVLAISSSTFVESIELTFELPDNAKQCFHEEIEKGIKCTVEFQVSFLFMVFKDA